MKYKILVVDDDKELVKMPLPTLTKRYAVQITNHW